MRLKVTRRRALAAGLAACLVGGGAMAQGVVYTTPVEAAFKVLMPSGPVAEAMIHIGSGAPQAFEEQKRLGAMPVPARAQYIAAAMREMGLRGVRADGRGGVAVLRPGVKPGPRLMVSARVDTGEDVRGLVCLLAALRALQQGGVRIVGDVVFAVFDAKSDVAALLRETGRLDAWIAVENDAASAEPLMPPGPVDAGLTGVTWRAAQILGVKAPGVPASASPARVAMGMGVPAITLASGGAITRLIPPAQGYSPADEWKGPQSLMLMVLALGGVQGLSEPLLPTRAP